ncbi:unnamed protein product [Bursaphelenchus okinawaensis]|uniref:Tetraspanin n=1 Tax=Bursaphelenchus okinawaensis TaxID=465554 RepID=A0A811LNY8_9BILA|nr:unnamed protein product [Bursaphelenchus okinawaensis]CAG9125894.1 unnamed protein product [Bursaphelenchus okinawaensis]
MVDKPKEVVSEAEAKQLKTKLTDVEGKLSKFILNTVKRQILHDIRYLEKLAPARAESTFYSLLVLAILYFTHTIAMLTVLYQTCMTWYFHLQPIKDVMDLLFKKGFVLEPTVLMMVLKFSAKFIIFLMVITILVHFMLLYVTAGGNTRNFSILFGTSRLLNSMSMLFFTVILVVLQFRSSISNTLIGHIALHGIDANEVNAYDIIQYELECCGFQKNALDWQKPVLMNWTDSFDIKKFEITNNKEYESNCKTKDSQCLVPKSCCTNYNPSKTQGSLCNNYHSLTRALEYAKTKNKDLTYQELIHSDGCINVLQNSMDRWFIVLISGLVYLLVTIVVTTCIAANSISGSNGLGIVDPVTEVPLPKHKGLRLAEGLDAPNLKRPIFTLNNSSSEDNQQEQVVHDAIQGKRNRHLNPEDSSDDGLDMNQEASYLSLGL